MGGPEPCGAPNPVGREPRGGAQSVLKKKNDEGPHPPLIWWSPAPLWARKKTTSIEHQASGIRHRASRIGHQASGIRHRASGIRHRASGIRHRALARQGELHHHRHHSSTSQSSPALLISWTSTPHLSPEPFGGPEPSGAPNPVGREPRGVAQPVLKDER